MIIIGHTRDAQGHPTIVEGTTVGERLIYTDGPCECIRMRRAGHNVWSDCMGCNGIQKLYDHSSADLS
jgi:hypothetical protein